MKSTIITFVSNYNDIVNMSNIQYNTMGELGGGDNGPNFNNEQNRSHFDESYFVNVESENNQNRDF